MLNVTPETGSIITSSPTTLNVTPLVVVTPLSVTAPKTKKFVANPFNENRTPLSSIPKAPFGPINTVPAPTCID